MLNLSDLEINHGGHRGKQRNSQGVKEEKRKTGSMRING
jgi:hypothetical protein